MEKPTEYAALDFDGTERRANYRTVAYRIDILHLCERKDAAAILYEIIYRWQTEVRKPEITKEIERRKKANLPPLTEDEVDNQMWVWMSYNDFVRESGGAVGYNTVIRMLDYLVEDVKIVECRENHDPRYPDYEYRVRLDIVKEKLKALPATPAFLPKVPKKKSNKGGESTQMGTAEKRSTQKGRRAQRSTQVGTDSTQMGTATTQQGREVYPDGGTSHTTTHTSHIEHTEDTYRASGSTEQHGADAPTPTDVPYLPNFKADQSRIATPTEDTDGHNSVTAHSHSGDTTHLPASTVSAGGSRPAVDGDPRRVTPTSQQNTTVTGTGGSGYRTPAEVRASQQNLTGARSQQGARQQGKQNEKPQLTLMGQQVRSDYEIIRAVRLRLTAKNIEALNVLGDLDGMEFASLKEVIELIEDDPWVKARPTFTFDVQDLASEDGKWRFDRWYPLVVRNRQKQASKAEPPKQTQKPTALELARAQAARFGVAAPARGIQA